jgi:CRP-like cAMP-binding protein
MNVAFFRNLALTKGLSSTEIERLSALVLERSFAEGGRLCVEGATTPGLFLIRGGKVKVVKRGTGKSERTMARFEAPTVLGEIELMTGRACVASVIAESPVDAWLLSPEAFDRLVNEGDAIASKITRNIARVVIDRLAETSSKLVSLLNG